MPLLPLRTGRLAVDLDPATGGTLTCFTRDGVDILRPGSGTNGACYPLVPFSNRIRDGRFAFDGRTIEVALSLPADRPPQRHPMHGDGWAASWQVLRADAVSAEIGYTHDGRTGWPFRYRARQSFRLGEDSLAVSMSLENLEPEAVPGGLGLHPFFARDPDSTLTCRTEAVWLADAEVLPIERAKVPAAWDFASGRAVDTVALDNGFDGWDGVATIAWPSRGLSLRLTASPIFRHLVIFTPPGRPFFCVEPVSHANGAIATTRLEAGATLAGDIVFTLQER